MKRAADFLHHLWPSTGFVFVGAKTPSWVEVALPEDDREDRLREFLREHLDRSDLYFCPTSFNRPRRLRRHARATRWLHCDVDEGDTEALEPAPSILLETSPNRTQALWRLDRRVSVDDAEAFNRAFAEVGDAGGWSITKMLRIPGWPAAGFVDTEIRCLTELEGGNAKKEVQPRVQA